MEHKQLYKVIMATKSSSRHSAGIKARNTIISRNGDQYYARIGKKGGSRTDTKPKGFEADRGLARRAGAKGGRAPRHK